MGRGFWVNRRGRILVRGDSIWVWAGVVQWADDHRAEFGVGGKDTMVADQVCPRSGDECGELLNELQRCEFQVTCAVIEWASKLEEDVAVRQEVQALVGDGWPKHVPGDSLQPHPLRISPKSARTERQAQSEPMARKRI